MATNRWAWICSPQRGISYCTLLTVGLETPWQVFHSGTCTELPIWWISVRDISWATSAKISDSNQSYNPSLVRGYTTAPLTLRTELMLTSRHRDYWKTIHRQYEQEKKRAYDQRIREVEHGCLSGSGGMVPTAKVVYKRLPSIKDNHCYSQIAPTCLTFIFIHGIFFLEFNNCYNITYVGYGRIKCSPKLTLWLTYFAQHSYLVLCMSEQT